MKLGLNALGLIGARVASDALSLFLFVLISRHFGPAGTGDYSTGFALATFAFMAVCLGLDSYGVRQFALLPAERRGLWMGELLGTQGAMIILSVLGVGAIIAFTGGGVADYTIVAWLLTYQVLTALARTLFIPAVAVERMVWPAVADVVCRGLAVGITVHTMHAYPHARVQDVLIGFPIAGVALVAIAFASAVQQGIRVRFRLSTATLRGVVVSLWSFAAAEVLQVIFSRLGLLTVSDLVGDAAAGQYSAGQKLLELSCIPLVLIGTASYPRLVRLFETSKAEFDEIALRLLWLMIVASGCIAWAIYFIAPPILVPLLGERFAASEAVIQRMSAVALVQSLESLMWPMILAAHLQVPRFKIIVAGTLVSLIVHVGLVRLYGLNGAIFATFLSFAFLVVLFANLLRRFLPIRFLALAAVSFLLALSLGLALFSFEPDSPAWWMTPWPLVGYLAPVGVGFWWLQHSLRSLRSLRFDKTTQAT